MNLVLISPICETICFLASLTLYFQEPIPKYLKTFPFFLLITTVVEITSLLFMQHSHNLTLLFIIFTSFEFVYYLFIVSFSIANVKVRKVILWISAIYPVLVLLNRLFYQVKTFHTVTYSIGCLLVVAACIYYFFELFQNPRSVDLKKEPSFWICSALLFFYCCTFPLIGLYNQLHGLTDIILQNLNAILQLLNVLLYSLFSIACLCRIGFRKPVK
jgi:hypothetical protein